MAEQFDAYHKWLGISPEKQPPNLYRLLALDEFESDLDVIEAAADQRMSHLRNYESGKHADLCDKLLNEISAARITLLNPDKKAEYDRQLKLKFTTNSVDLVNPPREQLGGETTLSTRPNSALPLVSDAAPPILKTETKTKDKSVWIAPVCISVAAVAIFGVLLAVIILVGLKKGDVEKAVAGQSENEQPVSSPDDPTNGVATNDTTASTTPSEKLKENSSVGPSSSEVVDVQPDGTKNNGETTSPIETIDDPPTKLETGTTDNPATNGTSTHPVEPTTPIEIEAPKKRPLPTDAQQKPVLATLEETFKLSERRTDDEALKLADELFKLAGQAKDPVEKFVLLRGTMKYAGEGGDAQLLIQAINAIDRDYEIDRLDIAQKALIGYSALASSETHFGSLAKATEHFIAEAIAGNRVDLAQGLAQEVYNAAVKRSIAAPYRKQFYEQRKQVDELFAQRRQVKIRKPN